MLFPYLNFSFLLPASESVDAAVTCMEIDTTRWKTLLICYDYLGVGIEDMLTFERHPNTSSCKSFY
jgi:hypothetical protein